MTTRIIDNRYDVIKLLGSGITGEVYHVTDLSNHREKALKIISKMSINHEKTDWLRDEFRRLSKLQHPYIITVYDFGYDQDKTPYFTMEYMPGGPLSLEKVPYDESLIIGILGRVCLGLQYIHSRGYIHGDITCENILLKSRDFSDWQPTRDIQLKVSDFAFLDMVDTQIHNPDIRHKPLTGTLPYCAPEKFFQCVPDYRSDLYSLGVVLYYLCTETFPFTGNNVSELVENILKKQPVPPTRLNPKISDGLEYLILTLLEKEPLKRFQSAQTILNDMANLPESPIKEIVTKLTECPMISAKFIGREAELSRTQELMDNVEGGKGQVLFLFGEAGIGRTSYCKEIKTIAQLKGFTVVLTKCGAESKSFLSPLQDILVQLGFDHDQNQELLSQSLEERLDRLVHPGEYEQDESQAQDKQDGDFYNLSLTTLYEAQVRFIENKTSYDVPVENDNPENAEVRPIMIIVEDCHNAHTSVLQFCEFLIRNCPRMPLFLCLTYCDDEIVSSKPDTVHPIVKIIERNEHLGHLHSMRLPRLTLEETSKMVTMLLEISKQPGGFVKNIHEFTGGNPHHIHELLIFLLDNHLLTFEQGNWWISDKDAFQDIPNSIRLLYEKRLTTLSELQKTVLQSASFLPQVFMLDDLVNVTGKDHSVITNMIDDFTDLRLLERIKTDHNVSYSFRSPLLRQLVFKQVKQNKKVELHLKTAYFLEQQYQAGRREQAGILSFHYLSGAEREKAITYAMKAADFAHNMYNYEEEIYYLERAKSLLVKLERSKVYLEVMQKLASAYFHSNRFQETIDTYEQFIESENVVNNLELMYELNWRWARAYERIGNYQKARDIYRTTLSHFPKKKVSPEVVNLKIRLGWVLCQIRDYQKARSIMSSSLTDAKSLKSPELIARVYILLGKIAEDHGNHTQAESYLQKALDFYRQTDSKIGIYTSFNNLGTLADKMGNWQKAIEYHRKSLVMKQKYGHLPGQANSLSNIATIFGMHGDWEQSQFHFQQALDIFRRLGNREAQSSMLHNLGELYLRKGEFTKSRQHFQKALQLREQLDDEVSIASTYLSLANLAIQQCEYEAAHDYLNRTLPIFRKNNLKRFMAVQYRLSAETFLRQENVSHALREIVRAQKTIDQVQDLVEKGNIFRLYSEITQALGDHEKAKEALNESIELFEKAGVKYELGLTYLYCGEQQLKADQLREAGFSIEKASEILNELGTVELQKKLDSLKQELNARLQPFYFHLPPEQEQLKSLIRVSQLINSIGELDRLLEETLDIIIKTLKADRGALFLKDKITGQLQPEVIRNIENDIINDAAQLSTTVMSSVVLRGEPVYISDAKIDSLTAHSKSVVLHGIVSILCVPLKVYDDLIGVVYLDSRSMADIFIEKDLQFVAAFANMAALAITNGLERDRLVKENNQYRSQTNELFNQNNIIGSSKKMQAIMKTVAKIASSSSTVMVTGESGTGKELIARAIHNMGTRRDKTFLPFFCGTAPETLIDSELFGHVKGAFSGAINNKKGVFEEANGGTVFLDEISEISPQIQAKLLRFLQEREIKPLGSNVVKKLDVRIVAASNRDLEQEVKKDRFRKDLFYRLNVIRLELPTLNDRKEDIPALAHHFLQKYEKELGKNIKGFTKIAMQRLMEYSWPGNVRELENQIEMAVNLVEEHGYIDEAILSDEVRSIENVMYGIRMSGSLKEILMHVERELIVNALMENKGNKTKTARRLGITRQNLNQKLKNLNIY